MSWNISVRQVHRWVSILFTAIVVFITVSQAAGAAPAEWVYFLPLAPLGLLLLTGLYLFALPYIARRRGRL